MSGPLDDVSRETTERLAIYENLLKKWNPKITLVAPQTLSELHTRHIVDSAQIYAHIPLNTNHVADFGSGGGFPGLVLCILDYDCKRRAFSLVESDQRKATFLRTVVRETGINATIHAKRIEEVPPLDADVVTARALSSLTDLLQFASRHLTQTGICLFPKGQKYKDELAAAREFWHFSCDVIPSMTAENSMLLKVGDVTRA